MGAGYGRLPTLNFSKPFGASAAISRRRRQGTNSRLNPSDRGRAQTVVSAADLTEAVFRFEELRSVTTLFTAVERFDPSCDERWQGYIEWSGLGQLQEVVSLDGILCPNFFDKLIERRLATQRP